MLPTHIITNFFLGSKIPFIIFLCWNAKVNSIGDFEWICSTRSSNFSQFLRKRKLIFPLESFKRSWKSKTNLLPPFKNSRSCNLFNHVGNLMAIIRFYNWATIFDWRKSFIIYEARLIFQINLFFANNIICHKNFEIA